MRKKQWGLGWGLLIAVILAQLSGPIGTARADGIVYTVQPGDNLFRIGLQYGVTWQDIEAANGLSSALVYVGQQLTIPVGSGSTPDTATTPSPTVENPAPPPGTTAQSNTYVVARGDTLGSIARAFGISIPSLAAANDIGNYDIIYSGETLTIPGADAVANSASVPPAVNDGSKLILIDISEQHMYVYQDGAVIWSWVTSTGEPGRETAPGHYSVLNKIDNAYGATWNLWMPHWLGIYWAGSLQNGIHALPILSDGSKLWAGWLGTPVSFGCVILSDENAETLYNWAEVGTPVDIQW